MIWSFKGGPLDGLIITAFNTFIDEITITQTMSKQLIDHVYILTTIDSCTEDEEGGVACFIYHETRRRPYEGGGLEDFDNTNPAPPYL